MPWFLSGDIRSPWKIFQTSAKPRKSHGKVFMVTLGLPVSRWVYSCTFVPTSFSLPKVSSAFWRCSYSCKLSTLIPRNHSANFTKQALKAREYVRDGRIGEIEHVTCHSMLIMHSFENHPTFQSVCRDLKQPGKSAEVALTKTKNLPLLVCSNVLCGTRLHDSRAWILWRSEQSPLGQLLWSVDWKWAAHQHEEQQLPSNAQCLKHFENWRVMDGRGLQT